MAVAAPPNPSTFTAFFALVVFTLRRQGQIRQMAWVAMGLLALLTFVVGVMSHGPVGWGLPDRYNFRYETRLRDFPATLTQIQVVAISPQAAEVTAAAFGPFQAMLRDPEFLADWKFLNFSRWVVFVMYLNFLLPLFTLSYASGAIGSERESRTMIWLLTRPLPRWAVYIAKLLGVLPWCILVSVGGLAILCLAGGDLGLHAFRTYWFSAMTGTIAFSAFFHFIGTIFRRPAIVGLVYIFFFEMLVANLPGSLKELSLNFYTRSLLYHDATSVVGSVEPASLDVYAPATTTSATITLLLVTVVISLIGIYFFGRQEPQDEI
jgi:ABC-2 type transport system permease protein